LKKKYKKELREEIETLDIKEDNNEEYGERTPNRKRKRGELGYKYSTNISTSFKKDVKKAAK